MNWTQLVLPVSIVLLIFIAIGFFLLQVVSYIGMRKRRQHYMDLHKKLRPGLEVMLTDGVYGKLTSVQEDVVRIQVAKDTVLKVDRASIAAIIEHE